MGTPYAPRSLDGTRLPEKVRLATLAAIRSVRARRTADSGSRAADRG